MIFLKFIRDDGAIMNIGDGAEDYELLSKTGTSNVEVEHYYDAKGSGYGDWHSGERVKGRTLKYKITSHTGIAASRRFMEFFLTYFINSEWSRILMAGRFTWIPNL